MWEELPTFQDSAPPSDLMKRLKGEVLLEREQEVLSPNELVQLSALDSLFFAKTFFPRTFRAPFASFHSDLWRALDYPQRRYLLIQIFRGGAKTTNCRVFTAKRIAFGISHTILYTGRSEAKALASTRWLRRQIEHNTLFAQTFGLRKGGKWQDHEMEIIHGVDEYPIWVLGVGITGSVRGINIDDYRPDLIVMDDVIDLENAATPEQRKNMNELIYGALANSLVSSADNPTALMVGLQTPLDREDYSVLAENDPEWQFLRFGCWTRETENLPLEQQVSAWPEYFPSEELRDKKRAYIKRNQLSIFLREWECKITSPETSAFKMEWLKKYELPPSGLTHVLVIDPVPPPSPTAVKKGLYDKDFEAMAVVGVGGGKFYIREISVNQGHTPEWTVTEFFRLAQKYRVSKVLVESVAYQATLAWLLRQAMNTRREYYVVEEYNDRRSKFARITDGITAAAANGVLFLPEDTSPGLDQFLEQYYTFPYSKHDDALEAVAVAVSSLQGRLDGYSEDDLKEEEDDRGLFIGVRGETLAP